MSPFPEPNEQNLYLVEHVQLLRESLKRSVKRDLIDPTLPAVAAAQVIFEAPFVVVSHDTASDPIFNYANQTALTLFEMTWSEFTSLPSRQSAEPPNQAERAQLLGQVSTQGYVDGYSGVRWSKTGRRFRIEQVTIWNLVNPRGDYQGQAAIYSHWTYL